MPRVLNKRWHGVPPYAVYVGRPSKWGNPFSHLQETLAARVVASRDEAIRAYRGWLEGQPDLMKAAKEELRGMDLVCWCAPAPCHAEVLMEVANS